MTHTIIIAIAILDILAIGIVFFRLVKRAKQLDFIKENYKPYLRQNVNGFLEYSVDHKLWSPVVKFIPEFTHIDNKGNYYNAPALNYIKVTDENKDKLSKEFCTVQKIWENNNLAFTKYREALYSWLEENCLKN